jgi:hypothetical protein
MALYGDETNYWKIWGIIAIFSNIVFVILFIIFLILWLKSDKNAPAEKK